LKDLVPDGVISSHTDPVRDRPVLPHLLRQLLLDPEGLVWRLQNKHVIKHQYLRKARYHKHKHGNIEKQRGGGEGKNHFPELGAWRQETEAADMKPSLIETLNCSAWMFYSREELTSSFIWFTYWVGWCLS